MLASKYEGDWQGPYEFVLSKLKASKYPEAEGEFEITFAFAHLSYKNIPKALEMLRNLRKKEPSLKAHAATHLSFLYFIEQNFDQADEAANTALKYDKYTPRALVNKGNCLFQAGKDDQSKNFYLEAVGDDSISIEALYNLGFVSKTMGL